jgi:hypothetical protein
MPLSQSRPLIHHSDGESVGTSNSNQGTVSGAFVTLAGERYYAISNVDKMAPFFMSLVSDQDHWLFVASNGGLTAGRVSPDTALFPYVTVDKIYDNIPHTGSKTSLRVQRDGKTHSWEPFNYEHGGRFDTTRNLYKSVLGNKVLFEEINHDLGLVFRYRWLTSATYGFVRHGELENTGASDCRVEMLDGLQNLLPAGTPRFTQTNSSYLVDAYKWSELNAENGLALFTLFSGISDRAEPCESLRATTVFCLGLDDHRLLLSSQQLDDFRRGGTPEQETGKRGIRGAYLINASLDIASGSTSDWRIVANTEQSQAAVAALAHELRDPATLSSAVTRSIEQGSDTLARIMAAGDGFQITAEENVTAHHYANVLFNVLRGGIVDDQYRISSQDFCGHVARFNHHVARRHAGMLAALPRQIDLHKLTALVHKQNDPELERLAFEYLPITFGRRHGDPSRPWNQFAINLTDEHGNRLLTYQGNWRDIFQNWEALLLGFPEFTESVIAKFVNASTADGYNPYRITNEGIDWEVEEPDDPWSYIGYWGDHQIIYLLKLLELSDQFHPTRLGELMHENLFSYANVPYRIRPFDALLNNAKATVDYADDAALEIERRVADIGSDGKLLQDADGRVYQVNLLEKLLVPLLAKLGNLVVDGGIWLNTQRPEWNDANNALVGHGLSMVTLYYLRRYIAFLSRQLASGPDTVTLSTEVDEWLGETANALHAARDHLGHGPVDADQRYRLLAQLGEAASRYRTRVYQQHGFSGTVERDLALVSGMLADAATAIDHSIRSNRGDDGLYHAYNLLDLRPGAVEVDRLYPMLEGQVAVLSSGAIEPLEAVTLLDALFDSPLYRPDQLSFLLYPDRQVTRFLDKNRVPKESVASLPLLQRMLKDGERGVIERDVDGAYRFNADLTNVGDLAARLDELAPAYGDLLKSDRAPLLALYEDVFEHKAFTGRSGGMFGFEGLGSIYWHMVSKLLLAVQEVFFAARDAGAEADVCRRLAAHYYRVREGIGFNKTPAEYGAFPTDPYSHTPAHTGAQQPGMTGQVKEEMLTRFAELGLRVHGGAVRFDPCLLRAREFSDRERSLRYLDVSGSWQEIAVPQPGLAFTWCQVPIIYHLDDAATPAITVTLDGGERKTMPDLRLPADLAQSLFRRRGDIRKIELTVTAQELCDEK